MTNKKKKEYNRKRLNTKIDGKKVRLLNIDKRPRPKDNLCEVCHQRKARDYHHYVDAYPEVGIWLCDRCHKIGHQIDDGQNIVEHAEEYLVEKERIQNEAKQKISELRTPDR